MEYDITVSDLSFPPDQNSFHLFTDHYINLSLFPRDETLPFTKTMTRGPCVNVQIRINRRIKTRHRGQIEGLGGRN